ncbi:MAG: DUF1059 domain-containing protein [Methanoregulaceae archaeon]|nr:DUF1059 domain-containing protein [Methanoregulaceae archaeon]
MGRDYSFTATALNEADLEKKIAEHTRSAHGFQSLGKDM